ncbi:methyltransferase domain-containing protein [Alphaproteobacteria bacterium]|nr:methyltransferase domain-containing protein [Alphaproteobacteria bacterium]
MNKFSQISAEHYDAFNAKKNYQKECRIIEKYFFEPTDTKQNNILDLGCGSGSHLSYFLHKNYQIHGIDISADMIELAKKKYASINNASLFFEVSDLLNIKLAADQYSNVISMYSVLGYFQNHKSLQKIFETVYVGLMSGGRFIFDVWDEETVLNLGPSDRVKHAQYGDSIIMRKSKSVLKKNKKTVDVKFNYYKDGKKIYEEAVHTIKFYSTQYIISLAKCSGFEIKEVIKHPHADALDEDGWNALYILEKL